ncbi:hypothetical protein Gogos_004706 [Gossypium gossypioides]|uniref:Uncharacterized protein n=1 Tax=Gossypium gossypioides TaxID=34282 RepID=A0A7J9CHC5_GOSGO|nr:hypothetical protein [Gossypium gossypioides]
MEKGYWHIIPELLKKKMKNPFDY